MVAFVHYRRSLGDYFQSKMKKYFFAIYSYDCSGWSYEYKGITDKKEGLITDLEQLKKVEKEENNHE